MAQTFTLDQLIVEYANLTRNNGEDVVARVFYTLTDSTGRFRQGSLILQPTLNQTIKNTLNNLWDMAVTAIKNKEGIP